MGRKRLQLDQIAVSNVTLLFFSFALLYPRLGNDIVEPSPGPDPLPPGVTQVGGRRDPLGAFRPPPPPFGLLWLSFGLVLA